MLLFVRRYLVSKKDMLKNAYDQQPTINLDRRAQTAELINDIGKENNELKTKLNIVNREPSMIIEEYLNKQLPFNLIENEELLISIEKNTALSILLTGKILNNIIKNELFKEKGYNNYKDYFIQERPLALSYTQSEKYISIWNKFGNSHPGVNEIIPQIENKTNYEVFDEIGISKLSEVAKINDEKIQKELFFWIMEDKPSKLEVIKRVKDIRIEKNSENLSRMEDFETEPQKKINYKISIGKKNTIIDNELLFNSSEENFSFLLNEYLNSKQIKITSGSIGNIYKFKKEANILIQSTGNINNSNIDNKKPDFETPTHLENSENNDRILNNKNNIFIGRETFLKVFENKNAIEIDVKIENQTIAIRFLNEHFFNSILEEMDESFKKVT